MMVRLRDMLAVLLVASTALGAVPAIQMGATRITYTPDELGNNIPDFSYAGYKGGGVALPTLPAKNVLNPIAGDNRAAIQAAINTVSALTPDANGFRGAVMLGPGTFSISSTLTISASGVVLRGSGASTVLSMTGTVVPISISGSGGANTTGSSTTITDTYVPLGAKSFTVASASGLAVGSNVIIHRPWTQTWIDAMGMGITGPLGTEGWTPKTGPVFERTITGLSGTSVTVDIPLPTPIEQAWTTGTVQRYTDTGRIQNVGVENMTLFNTSQPTSGPDALDMTNCKNCWIKNLTMDGFENGIEINGGAKFVTVQDCTYQNGINIGSARPGVFNTSGQMCLYLRCTAISGFEHIIITQDSTAGPNAFVFIKAVNASSFDGGPHQKWALGVLMDNVSGPISALKIYNAGVEGTGHGWVCGYSIMYNCTPSTKTCQQPAVDHHYNFIIGGTGTINSVTTPGTYENTGTIVSPASLYVQQLKERLGTQAVANVGYARFSGNQKIMAENSSKFLSIQSSSAADNAQLIQLSYASLSSQQWQLVDIGGGYYEIKNTNSGKALAVSGASAAVQLTYAAAGTTGQWQVLDTTGGYSKFINRATGKALEVTAASTADNATFDQATYAGATYQQFQIISLP